MSLISTILKKIAKPPAPEVPCLRVAEVPAVSVPSDQVILSPTGEPLIPLSALPPDLPIAGRIYPVAHNNGGSHQTDRQAAIKVSSTNLEEIRNSRYLGDHLVIGAEGTGFLLAENLPRAFRHARTYSQIASSPRAGLDEGRNLPAFADLSELQKGLLGDGAYAEKRWSTEFTARQMKAFLVLTTLWENPALADRFSQEHGQKPLDSATLQKLKLTPEDLKGITLGSIHSDRKHFEITFAGAPESLKRLQTIFGNPDPELRAVPTERGFLADKPFAPFHPHTQEGGGRSPNSHYSLQFMLGEDQGAGDLDMFMPLHLPSETDGAGKRRAFFRHWIQHWGEIIVGKNLWPDYMAPDKVAQRLDIDLYAQP